VPSTSKCVQPSNAIKKDWSISHEETEKVQSVSSGSISTSSDQQQLRAFNRAWTESNTDNHNVGNNEANGNQLEIKLNEEEASQFVFRTNQADQLSTNSPTVQQQEEEELIPWVFDPTFTPCQFVHKDDKAERAPVTIKSNSLVQIKVSDTLIDQDLDVFVGIYHSHPDFSEHPVQAPDGKPPFNIQNIQNVHDVHLHIPDMNIRMSGCLVNLANRNLIDINFTVESTDRKNMGNKKEAKEWHLILIPLDKSTSSSMKDPNYNRITLTLGQCASHADPIRIQVRKEIRRKHTLTKGHRKIEVQWSESFSSSRPLKRKRLERMAFEKQIKRIKGLTMEELESEVTNM